MCVGFFLLLLHQLLSYGDSKLKSWINECWTLGFIVSLGQGLRLHGFPLKCLIKLSADLLSDLNVHLSNCYLIEKSIHFVRVNIICNQNNKLQFSCQALKYFYEEFVKLLRFAKCSAFLIGYSLLVPSEISQHFCKMSYC